MAGAATARNPDRFVPGVGEQLGYYVYLLIDPRDLSVFYVGKGTGDRCFDHLKVARTSKRYHTREFAKLDVIRTIEHAGLNVRIDVLRHGLYEPTAFVVEAAAMDLLGFADLTNVMGGTHTARRGRMTVLEVNAGFGAVPVTIDDDHRVVLIRVSRAYRRGMPDEALYEVTRGFWKVAQRWTDPTHLSSPQWAFAVYGRVVRAVYRIDRWYQPEGDELAADPTRQGRWGFHGTRDDNMEHAYLGKNVTAYLETGAQNPISYANCASKRRK